MRWRWSIVLPLFGLTLFLLGAYQGLRVTRRVYGDRHSRYLYWASARLDSDPLNRHPIPTQVKPCEPAEENCVSWEPDYIWIEPGVTEKVLVLSSFPAFAASGGLVALLARFGISQVAVFYMTTPLLIISWFYFVGWVIDRWRHKRLRQSSSD